MDRVRERIEALYALAPHPDGGADRPAFSEAEANASFLVAGWLRDAGLEVGVDPFGNLWGLPGGHDGPVVTSGSHVDTVPSGGRFDGPLGTVLAVEAVSGLEGPSGVLVCAAEEASRFGAGTLGSRALTGTLSDGDLARLHDAHGTSALEARERYLAALSGLPRLVEPQLARLAGHVEVHIEQRLALRPAGAALGIATVVAGPTRHRLRFVGEVGHVGETPVDRRRDALCAAAEAVLLTEGLSRAGAPDVVATAGTMAVKPNSLTSIPGEVEVGVDVRSVQEGGAGRLLGELLSGARQAAGRRGVVVEDEAISASEPVALDEGVVGLAEGVCRRLGVASARCVSYAGHDAQHLSALGIPTALLFVASTNGESHSPGEDVDWADVGAALRVLPALLRELRTAMEKGGRP